MRIVDDQISYPLSLGGERVRVRVTVETKPTIPFPFCLFVGQHCPGVVGIGIVQQVAFLYCDRYDCNYKPQSCGERETPTAEALGGGDASPSKLHSRKF